MELSQDACWRALQTRDARFDGRFVTAVRSTGIYCRPVCPALPPKRANCLFLPCADLTRIGLTRARAAAISTLAGKVASGDLVIGSGLGLGETLRRLEELPGVGDWTAQYIAMRALGEPDAFPATDLGLRRALAAGAKPIESARLAEIAEAWRPWRAYAAMALWMSLTR